ncbi:pyridoxal kinase PdxY [Meiothermus taiwanensis]|uniref:Pyridoxal kinase PdxY n=2 Tax=Meiothermus taiwanensis TaxID=172827 RepID=A0A399E8C3_9DEIN|nr:pyridoxal kinase PdxY [Meiothermus taiwanensis]AWR85854.1 pyridoxal kinase [Meiothermus taiwanensis WR-220]KZK16616.1 pyridoxal kinase [Meiothermus taiwanensis]RIH79753.1 Pyridoxal kinase PdxY [Meiothermus taiwanensis]
MQPPRNILSIQSWVSYGHVGNAAAVFPLQRMGFEVWAIHTVQFSNHTGYGQWKGMILPPEHLVAVVEGIAEREVLGQCDAVLSGYMGSGGTAEAILSALGKVRQLNPSALFCCDPVMGDEGRGLFVRPEIPEIIKTQVLPQADILTPNQFELELLTGLSTKTLPEALEAARMVRAQMHPGGPRIVVVTSLLRQEAPENTIETLAVADEGAWLVRTPRIPLEPPRNGTGDAIAALFLGHYLQTQQVAQSLEHAVSAMYNLLLLTHQMNTREIQLIAAQDEYVRPSRRFAAERVG